MRIRLSSLDLQFKNGSDSIEFDSFNYFYGKMGAGKTSIANLIDFCLGGDFDLTPALQIEFTSAKLYLNVDKTKLSLERIRESNQIIASWKAEDVPYEIVVPAKRAAGEVLPGTGVENVSDLVFYLSGVRSPKVRKSKKRDDSELERLSIRNLMWYCYLDQDSMDSSFFNLDPEAAFYKRNKSKDVLRYVVGFHQEQVAELETLLQEKRDKRLSLQSGAESLKIALEGEGIGDEVEIASRINELEDELGQVSREISFSKQQINEKIPHYIDTLRKNAREVTLELISLEDAIVEIQKTIDGDRRHINELKMLRVKFKRATSAKSILAGVDFISCPRCSQDLPKHDVGLCPICGQNEPEETVNNLNPDVLEIDVKERIKEIEDAIERHSKQLNNLQVKHAELTGEKTKNDDAISSSMKDYDSAYLSATLGKERRKAEIEQTIFKLEDYIKLSRKVGVLLNDASSLEAEEIEIRRELKEARKNAEKDTANIKKLETLFLDCLLRSKWPGIDENDVVSITAPNFLPEVISPDIGDLAVISFSNTSSGGKKSIFKTCFAVAFHRLAAEIDAMLPTFLIIDSPMKNISERENKDEFEGFHKMLYDLAQTELSNTQFILIDKEFCAPTNQAEISVKVRHMTPDDTENPPLIKYYQGH